MRLVKTILVVTGLFGLLLLACIQDRTTASPVAPTAPAAFVPARADLAEAVFAMVVENAQNAGLPQPTTLCQACVAAHLGLASETLRNRCQRACGLR